MFQCRVSSNIADLNELNKDFSWIPNDVSIRPDEVTLQRKHAECLRILSIWPTFYEYIFSTVFEQAQTPWVFIPSTFRYNLPPIANHYVLWNSDQDFTFDYDEEFINMKIKEELAKISTSYDFVWYKNPKPTVMEFYHVQVFWICLQETAVN
jgi:hypothetical protein